jgi:Amt family ammonium transporter
MNEFQKPNYEPEEESSMWMSIGTFILWLGWYFFNGGSAYTLYNPRLNPAKIITNTIISGSVGGCTVYFVKKPLSLYVCKSCRKRGVPYHKPLRASKRYDTSSMCNGVLAGLVAITAGCDVVEPWAAVVIGVIAGILYSVFPRLILMLRIDDPLEASAVHYVNGIWGVLSVIIFDETRGFISGSSEMGSYLAVQVYGLTAISFWVAALTMAFFLPMKWLGWAKYHPVIELLGAHRFKMGEITQSFLLEIRSFGEKQKAIYQIDQINLRRDEHHPYNGG